MALSSDVFFMGRWMEQHLQNGEKTLSFNPLSDLLNVARVPIGALFALSVVSNILMLTGSIFMLQVYDRVLPSRSIPTLVALTLLVAVLFGFYALIEWLRARMAVRLGGLVDQRFGVPILRAAIRQRLTGRLGISPDPVRDLDNLRQFLSSTGPVSLLDLPWMPIYLAVAFLLHPLLGLLATAGAVAIAILLVVNEFHSRLPGLATTAATLTRNAHTSDARSNAESVIAMGMVGPVSKRWATSAAALSKTQRHSADQTAFYSSVTKGFRYLLQSLVLGVGAYLVIEGQITAGLMIAASILTSRALAPLEQVVAHWRGFVSARQATIRIRDTLALTAIPPRKLQLPLPSETLTVANLAAGADLRSPPLIAGIKFELKSGDAMGIIGLSGSGKSTLARALIGVWPVLYGEIRLDGSELSHFDPERLGQSIGYLPQSVELFDGTVAENIARFRGMENTEAILTAAEIAGVNELITSLDEGYDTRIGANGSALSAGQRQRIGLARALFNDPFLIVLDEPNSNLDAEGDAALSRALIAARKRGAIIIVIAHRPSAISSVNKLLFMERGRQAAFGDKDNVLRQITRQPTLVSANREAADGHPSAK